MCAISDKSHALSSRKSLTDLLTDKADFIEPFPPKYGIQHQMWYHVTNVFRFSGSLRNCIISRAIGNIIFTVNTDLSISVANWDHQTLSRWIFCQKHLNICCKFCCHFHTSFINNIFLWFSPQRLCLIYLCYSVLWV